MIGGIILAAGKSSRMGGPKPLLPWNNDYLINNQISTLSESGASEIIIVLGHKAKLISQHISAAIPTKVIINQNYSQGKTTSIRAGFIAASNRISQMFLIGVDQPRTPELLDLLLYEHLKSGAFITQPIFHGKGGHPLIFHSSLFSELLTLEEHKFGVREIIKNHTSELNQVIVEDKSVTLDLNTPEEVAIARDIFRISEGP